MAYFSHPLLITSFPSYVQLQKQLQDYKAIGDQVLNFDEFVVSIWVGKSIFCILKVSLCSSETCSRTVL